MSMFPFLASIVQIQLKSQSATSSMESEYMAMYGGMQELVWIRGVLSELLLTALFGKSTPFYIDSQSAEDLAMNPAYHKRSKHIFVKYHWIREHVDPDGLATARLTMFAPKIKYLIFLQRLIRVKR